MKTENLIYMIIDLGLVWGGFVVCLVAIWRGKGD